MTNRQGAQRSHCVATLFAALQTSSHDHLSAYVKVRSLDSDVYLILISETI